MFMLIPFTSIARRAPYLLEVRYIFLLVVILLCHEAKAQNSLELNDFEGQVYLGLRNAQLKSDVDNIPFDLPYGFGGAFGIGVNKSVYDEYDLGLGMETGLFYVGLRPKEDPLGEIGHHFYYLHFPFYVRRIFPISYRLSIVAQSGVSLNVLISSLSEISSTDAVTGSENTLAVSRKIAPMPGILLSVGLNYDLFGYYSLTFNIFYNPVLVRQLEMKYTYQPEIESVAQK